MLRAFIDLEPLDGIVLSSSVPQLVREYEAFAERWAGVELLVLGPGVSTGMTIRYDDPREVGPDRIANAVAARERHGAPAIVVDFGTSTNFDVVSPPGSSRAACSRPESRSRWTRCSRGLRGCRGAVPRTGARDQPDDDGGAAVGPRLWLRRPGRRIVDAHPRRARRGGAPVIATGGLADLIAPHSRDDHRGRSRADAQGLGSSGSATRRKHRSRGSVCVPIDADANQIHVVGLGEPWYGRGHFGWRIADERVTVANGTAALATSIVFGFIPLAVSATQDGRDNASGKPHSRWCTGHPLRLDRRLGDKRDTELRLNRGQTSRRGVTCEGGRHPDRRRRLRRTPSHGDQVIARVAGRDQARRSDHDHCRSQRDRRRR